MPKYRVTLYKPVSDVLRGTIEIEAENSNQAELKALHRSHEVDYQFWQSTANPDPITAESEPI